MPMILSAELLATIEAQLSLILNPIDQSTQLMDAMRYSALSGGKRIRPLLVIAAGRLSAADTSIVMQVGCALELLHCYSLIHDDLPAMDDDDLRRGLPTCHVKYGEATAILAGDALQTRAFEILSTPQLGIDAKIQLQLVNLFAKCAGAGGMVGGQALDLMSNGHKMDLVSLQYMHSLKTGCLIQAAILAGYLCGKHVDQGVYQQLEICAKRLGLLFQIMDDILDVTEDSATLGKTANKDFLQDKATYVSVLGLEQARKEAAALYTKIIDELSILKNSDELIELVQLVYNRHN